MALMAAKNISMALTTMRSSRGRSFFTMFGVIIAVAAITTVVSVGNGIKTSVTQQANQYSKNVITVRPSKLGEQSGPLAALSASNITGTLTDNDAKAIAKVPHVSTTVPLVTVGSGAEGDSKYNAPVFAVSSDLPTVVNQELAFGAFFTSKDNGNNLAVLGSTAADKMFDQRVPLGRSFTIHGQQFIVAGVLSKFASTPFSGDANFNDAIFVPSGSAKSLAPNGANTYEILAKVDSSNHVDGADKQITSSLSKLHRGQQDFSVLSPTEVPAETASTFDLLSDLIVVAAIITLIVSGIGIMNVMLVSVTERVHEIGIRKAIGATNRQILMQFMTESVTLSLIGSLLGALLALVSCLFIHWFTTLTPQYDWAVAGLSCVAASIFGAIFGTLPALKAARKDPIAALRSE